MGAKEQGADALTVANRWQVVPRTLSFVTYQEQVLLLKRAPHKRVYPGYYNGVGGHIEQHEDPHSSALREIHEETGLDIAALDFCGSTHIDAGEKTGILLFIFTAKATSPDFVDTNEGKLEWFSIPQLLVTIRDTPDALPLVEDLPIILPLLFDEDRRHTPFFAHVSYTAADQIQIRFAKS